MPVAIWRRRQYAPSQSVGVTAVEIGSASSVPGKTIAWALDPTVSWTAVTVDPFGANGGFGVRWVNNRWLAGGGDLGGSGYLIVTGGLSGGHHFDHSNDLGVHWTLAATDPLSSADAVNFVALGDGRLLAGVTGSGAGPLAAVSSDGANWSAVTTDWTNVAALTCAAYGEAIWVLGGDDAWPSSLGHCIQTSPDLVTFTTQATPLDSLALPTGLLYAGGQFLAICQYGSPSTPCPVLMTSPDGMTWTLRNSPFDAVPSAAAAGAAYGAGLYVVGNARGFFGFSVVTSPDGTTWTSRSAALDNIGVVGVAWNGSVFVAVGGGGTPNVITSPDGITWTGQTGALDGQTIVSVAYDAINGEFYAVSAASSHFWISGDGITWTLKTNPAVNSFLGNSGAIAVLGVTAPLGASSVDGKTWTPFHVPALEGYLGCTVYDYAWTGSLWVVCGWAGFAPPSAGTIIATSPDLVTWTGRAASPGSIARKIANSGSFLVCVGDMGTLTSPDGVAWTGRSSGANKSVTWGGGQFVAVGDSGGSGNTIWTSPDGITWTSRTSPFTNGFGAGVEYHGGLYVAVGSNGLSTGAIVITSPDGVTWTARSTPLDGPYDGSSMAGLNAVAYDTVKGVWIAAGTNGATLSGAITSPDGITWTYVTDVTDFSTQAIAAR